ncbi:CheB methylesterase domain-containing protein [uncultured Selenomonas sp.]|uniref:CheB methylesterase domain-containing protein n=1 Tax=uncultured Selenomonas sp. TaxID=159275 RepID=UPI0028EFBA34|nr:CheB methylesterase domain-containing protein [uncultured Selenomonas sp.]
MTDGVKRKTGTGSRGSPRSRIVVVGSSTGGPQALQTVITGLSEHFPCPVVVVQHMPAGFTNALASRLHSVAPVRVCEARDGELLEPGCVYIAPGNYHLRVLHESGVRRIALSDEPPVGNHRPAVNVMYDSVAHLGKDVVAVILTGMGSDGREGMRRIKENGGYCIAQDEATCVVYGMPKSVIDAGLADEICPLPQIAHAIEAAVRR